MSLNTKERFLICRARRWWKFNNCFDCGMLLFCDLIGTQYSRLRLFANENGTKVAAFAIRSSRIDAANWTAGTND